MKTEYREVLQVTLLVMLGIAVGVGLASYQANGWIDWVVIKNIGFGAFLNGIMYITYLKWFKKESK